MVMILMMLLLGLANPVDSQSSICYAGTIQNNTAGSCKSAAVGKPIPPFPLLC